MQIRLCFAALDLTFRSFASFTKELEKTEQSLKEKDPTPAGCAEKTRKKAEILRKERCLVHGYDNYCIYIYMYYSYTFMLIWFEKYI